MSKEYMRAATAKYRAAHPEKMKAGWRKQTLAQYGLTEADFNAMVVAQGGVCAICHQPCKTNARLSVDHCHTSGKVRGLLCSKCNAGIAAFRDKPEVLLKAADYLELRIAPMTEGGVS